MENYFKEKRELLWKALKLLNEMENAYDMYNADFNDFKEADDLGFSMTADKMLEKLQVSREIYYNRKNTFEQFITK